MEEAVKSLGAVVNHPDQQREMREREREGETKAKRSLIGVNIQERKPDLFLREESNFGSTERGEIEAELEKRLAWA